MKGFKTLGSDFISDTMTVAKCVLSPIFYFILNWCVLLYNIILVSSVNQHGSTISTYASLPS